MSNEQLSMNNEKKMRGKMKAMRIYREERRCL